MDIVVLNKNNEELSIHSENCVVFGVRTVAGKHHVDLYTHTDYEKINFMAILNGLATNEDYIKDTLDYSTVEDGAYQISVDGTCRILEDNTFTVLYQDNGYYTDEEIDEFGDIIAEGCDDPKCYIEDDIEDGEGYDEPEEEYDTPEEKMQEYKRRVNELVAEYGIPTYREGENRIYLQESGLDNLEEFMDKLAELSEEFGYRLDTYKDGEISAGYSDDGNDEPDSLLCFQSIAKNMSPEAFASILLVIGTLAARSVKTEQEAEFLADNIELLSKIFPPFRTLVENINLANGVRVGMSQPKTPESKMPEISREGKEMLELQARAGFVVLNFLDGVYTVTCNSEDEFETIKRFCLRKGYVLHYTMRKELYDSLSQYIYVQQSHPKIVKGTDILSETGADKIISGAKFVKYLDIVERNMVYRK